MYDIDNFLAYLNKILLILIKSVFQILTNLFFCFAT